MQIIWCITACKRGVTAVEFAIIIPFVLLLTFGIMQITLNLASLLQVTDAVGIVSRELSKGQFEDIKANAETILKQTLQEGPYFISYQNFSIGDPNDAKYPEITFTYTYNNLISRSFGLGNLDWGSFSIPVTVR
jgi:hypothetical protein